MVIDAFLACLFNVHYLIFLSMVMNMHIFMNIFGNQSIRCIKLIDQLTAICSQSLLLCHLPTNVRSAQIVNTIPFFMTTE